MADIRKLYSQRVEAASIALGRGDRSEAERLYSEALTMGEERFGANDPSLAVPLNELSRLYVRRAEHARAEPLLQRLLVIRRASGETHPDVATVLAGLAAVRRGLGDDASAEDLYRQALAIRERVHAPDHMAVVVALEHLADTCVALHKFGEAQPLIERALAVREVALGPDHATARALRERLTDLAVKAAPIQPSAPRALPTPPLAPAPEEARVSKELVFIYEPEKPVRRASLRRDRVMTPPFSAAVAAASLITVPAHASAPAHAAAPTELAVTSLVFADPREFATAITPRADDERVAYEPAPRRSQRISSSARAEGFADRPAKRGKRYGFAAGGLAVLASAGFFASSRVPSRTTSEPSSLTRASEPVASVTRARAAVPAAAFAARTRLAGARPDSVRVSSAKPILAATASTSPTSPTSPPHGSPAEKRSAVSDMPLLPSVGILAIPETKAAPNADSVLRAITTRRDTDTDQLESAARIRTPVLADDRAETSPVLIGVVPQPRFPDALRAQRIDGAVVVQFLVGADGTVDPASMKVVRSPHALFTAAVRNVLPRLHFQPARTADAKPRAEWVQYSVEFSATK